MAETLLEKIVDYAVAPIKRQFSYICCFKRNIEKLETQFEELQRITQGVQLWVDAEDLQLKVIAPHITAWLKIVDDVKTEVGEIIKEKPEVKKGCLNGWCPNLKLRYSLGKKAVENTKVIVNLRKEGESYTKPSCSPPPTYTAIPIDNYMAFKSQIPSREEIIEALTNDKINLIGICGLPGVGKTIMAKQIAKQAREDGLFVEIAWANVSPNPKFTNVQACIASMLGLEQLGDYPSPKVRANLLRKRLLQDNKKILIILDDVWAEFHVEDIGIPLGGANKNFKMLYTSRNRGLWYDSKTKIEIPLERLSEDEAWKLFKDQVGDYADVPDWQPIAKEIVNACGSLPLKLVVIGKALSGNFTKSIWEDMRDHLTCSSGTPADSLEISYRAVEDEEAKRLFLLCCLFEEYKSISVEDLVRYALGFSLFDDRRMRMIKDVRARVFELVADLESHYLLLDDPCESDHKHVKVSDLVRDMGISIASKCKGALGSHGTVSEYPKKDAYEYALVSHDAVSKWPNEDQCQHYTFISMISKEIIELPEELNCPNLEFLLLRCHKPEKLSCHLFKGMGKLKVLELYEYAGIISTLQPLTNLTMLSLEGLNRGVLGYVPLIEPVIGDLLNLEILSFRNLAIEELPEEIGKLVKLRLLDLTGTHKLCKIPPGVISGLVCLEELYNLYSKFRYWEGDGDEKGRNANLIEFEFLSHLNTLEICISNNVLIPKIPIFRKLEKYKVVIGNDVIGRGNQYERQLVVRALGRRITSDHERLDSLLRSSDHIFLQGVGCYDLVRELLLHDGVDGLQQVKYLEIEDCNTPECLANAMIQVQQPPNAAATTVFPILEKLHICRNFGLREICHGLIPAGSFGRLTKIMVMNCLSLRHLFQLPVVECLTQLRSLEIGKCCMMEEVIWKEQREDVRIKTNNRIKFPKLKTLEFVDLPRLVGFCRGIELIDLPQLKELRLQNLGKVNCLFHNNNNLSSNSEQNNNMPSFSLFPEKVILPVLEVFEVNGLCNIVEIWDKQSPWVNENTAVFCKLRDMKVQHCKELMNLFPSNILPQLQNLQKLCVEGCPNIESVVFKNGKEQEAADGNTLVIPQLWYLTIRDMENLKSFYSSSTASTAQTLFNYQVKFPKLKYLELEGLQNMDNIWGSEYPTSSLSKLKFLKAKRCVKLKNIFRPSMAEVFVNLQELILNDCSKMEAVVDGEEEVEDGQRRKTGETLFPHFSRLELRHLTELRRVCHFARPLKLPLLSQMVIEVCPSLNSFSSGSVSFPNLFARDVSYDFVGDDTTVTEEEEPSKMRSENIWKDVNRRGVTWAGNEDFS